MAIDIGTDPSSLPTQAQLNDASDALRQYSGYVSIKDPRFGAVGDGVTDDTLAVQAAIDFAYTSKAIGILAPHGIYIASTLDFYSGQNVICMYQGSFGLGNDFGSDYSGTVFKQKAGVHEHFVCVNPLPSSDGYDRIGPLHVEGVIFVGNGEAGGGDGFRLQSRTNAVTGLENALCPRVTICQSLTFLESIFCRNFAGNGIWVPACHGGVQLTNVNNFFNGGFGILFDVSFGVIESTHLLNCDGDGNLLGNIGVYKMGTTFAASDKNGSVLVITALRGEQRVNPNAFASGAKGTSNLIVCDQCNSGKITINGIRHQSTIAGDKPDDTIVIKNQSANYGPIITIDGASSTVKTSIGQDVSADVLGYLINDTANSKTVSHDPRAATYAYGPNVYNVIVSAYATATTVVGGSGLPVPVAVPDSSLQLYGNTPFLIIYEQDETTDAKLWAIGASAKGLTVRTGNDAGSSLSIAEQWDRSGGVPQKKLYNYPVRLGLYTVTTLPTAFATFANYSAIVTNPAASKGRLVYCDGSAWRYVSDDSLV